MLYVRLLPGRGAIHTVAAVARAAAHWAPVLKTAVRTPPAALDLRELPPPIDAFEYRTGPPVDLFEYRRRSALLQVCVVLACVRVCIFVVQAKRTRLPPDPPVSAVARAAEGVGGSHDAH